MNAFINPDLRNMIRDIKGLKPDPNNVRLHSKRNLEAIAHSLSKYGQQKPIVACKGIVVAGNGTLEAALSLGWEKIAVIEFQGAEKAAYALADNRTAELAEWDFDKLSNQLNLFENQLELQSLWSPEEMQALQTNSEPLEPGMTPAEKKLIFEQNAIKQIVLYFTDEVYKDILASFRYIADTHQLDTNTDVVLKLLEFYEKHECEAQISQY